MTDEFICPNCPTGLIQVPTEYDDEREVACDVCQFYAAAGAVRESCRLYGDDE